MPSKDPVVIARNKADFLKANPSYFRDYQRKRQQNLSPEEKEVRRNACRVWYAKNKLTYTKEYDAKYPGKRLARQRASDNKHNS